MRTQAAQGQSWHQAGQRLPRPMALLRSQAGRKHDPEMWPLPTGLNTKRFDFCEIRPRPMRIRRGFSRFRGISGRFCRNFEDFLKIIAKFFGGIENIRTFVLSGGQSGSPLTSKFKTARL
jgi:hypothetical protein